MKKEVILRLIYNEDQLIDHPLQITSVEMGVKYRLVCKWSRSRVKILSSAKKDNNRRIGSGPFFKNLAIEQDIVEWVCELRN